MANVHNVGLVNPKNLYNFITGNLKANNQDVGSDGKVYNNMESDYVAGNNMLHDFESMLKKDGYTDQDLIKLINADNRDHETSKLLDSKEKSNTKEASSEELDPAQEEFFAQLAKKLNLYVDFCKKKFVEVLETDDEAVDPKNTSKTMQNKGRDSTLDNYSKAHNPQNKQQTGGMFNKFDKKQEIKFDKKKLNKVIKKFAKKYKLNPKAIKNIKKSLTAKIKQANKPDKTTQLLSVKSVEKVLHPRPTPTQQLTSKQKDRAF